MLKRLSEGFEKLEAKLAETSWELSEMSTHTATLRLKGAALQERLREKQNLLWPSLAFSGLA